VGVIGIVCPGGIGDILMSSSILKYKDELWPNKDIVWYCLDVNKRVLLNIPGIKEIRPLIAENYKYVWYHHDVDKMFTPCPWMNIYNSDKKLPPDTLFVDKPRLIFERDMGIKIPGPWHPCLEYTPEDDNFALTLLECLPFKKTIMFETAYYSNQSFLNQDILLKIISEIQKTWGDCNFLFPSGGARALIPEGNGMFFCSKLTLPPIVALHNHVDAFISVSSGISCAVCSWSASPNIPKLGIIKNPLVDISKISRGPISVALNEKELFEKLPKFLNKEYDFIPIE